MPSTDVFAPNRKLLNSKFEGYKLDPVDQDASVARFPLEHPATQSTASAKTFLSFPEVQSRISHNHLTVSDDGSRAVYVDEELKVISIELPAKSSSPVFRIVYELPEPIQSDDSEPIRKEYPSSKFLGSSTLFLADGYGSLYVLQYSDNGPSKLQAVYQLPDGSAFLLHSLEKVSDTDVIALTSSRVPDLKNVEFDISAARLPISPVKSSEVETLQVVWRRRGEYVPFYTFYDPSRNAFFLLGGSPYRELDLPVQVPYIPAPDEMAPVPQANEDLNLPPPYSWNQNDGAVTIAFPLPSTTQKTDIKINFSQRFLSLFVANLAVPHYNQVELWDHVVPATSYWTWDREGEHSYGLLTLYLDKKASDRKWTHVFAQSAGQVDVPETLDPSELYAIREALEKYTAAMRDGEDASGLGLGQGVPQMVEGEIDAEVDSVVGRTSFVTWVNATDGSHPAWYRRDGDTPFQLLSTPLPGSSGSAPSIIVKNDVDGIVFSLIEENEALRWEHTSTFSALAFVLATKQDTRFTYHIPGKAVYALENGSSERGGNVYVYRSTPEENIWAKQSILQLSNGFSGTLLGVGVLHQGSQTIIAGLTEHEIVLLKDA